MRTALRYVARNLIRRRARAGLGVLGISLSMTLLTAIRVGIDSVATSYTDLVALQSGRADIIITAPGSHPLLPEPFDPAPVEERFSSHPQLRGLARRLTGIARAGRNGREQVTLIIGLDPARERELETWGLIPDLRLADGSCALSPALAKNLGAEVGGRVDVRCESTGRSPEFLVEGVVERQLILPQEVRDFVLVSEASARALLDEPRRVHSLAGALRDGTSYYDARDLHASVLRLKAAGEAMAAQLGMEYDVRLPKAAALAAFQNVTSPLRALFGVFAVLTLSITGLLIYSIVSIAVEERIREYAILRALGGKRRDIVRLVLGESLLLCMLGVTPGVLAGIAFARGLVTLVALAMRAEGRAIALELAPATLWLTPAAGALLAIASALVPALQASRRRIVDALDPLRRGQIEPAISHEGAAHRPLVLTGVALSALAAVVFFVLPAAFLSGNPTLIGTVMLCLLLSILLGFTLVALGALPRVERLLLLLLAPVFGPATEIAGRNLFRHQRRNTTTALMFILSVALVIFVASLAVLVSRISISMVEHFTGSDIRLQSDVAEAGGMKARLEAIDGVTAVSEVRFLRSRSPRGVAFDVVASDLVGMKHLWIVPFAADPALADTLYGDWIRFAEGGPEALRELCAYQPPIEDRPGAPEPVPPLILSEAAARYLDLRQGSLVQLWFQLGAQRRDARFRVAAVCGAMPGFDDFRSRVANAVGSGALIPAASFRALTEGAPEEAFLVRYFLKTVPDEGVQRTVAARIRDDFDLRYRFSVTSAAERRQQARVLYWATQVLFGLLLTVAVMIAVFALMASMTTAVLERRWEIGMLKALGLRRRQLFRMFFAEAVTLTLAAGLIGGATGFGLAYLFVLEAAVLIEIPIIFTMPYLTFAVTFAVSLLAAAVATHLPTRRLLRQPAAEILRAGG